MAGQDTKLECKVAVLAVCSVYKSAEEHTRKSTLNQQQDLLAELETPLSENKAIRALDTLVKDSYVSA